MKRRGWFEEPRPAGEGAGDAALSRSWRWPVLPPPLGSSRGSAGSGRADGLGGVNTWRSVPSRRSCAASEGQRSSLPIEPYARNG